jgi:hypothetical protein
MSAPEPTPVPTPRSASGPLAGGARTAVNVALANIVLAGLATFVPPELMPDANVLVTAGLSGVFAMVGKYMRDRGFILGQVM